MTSLTIGYVEERYPAEVLLEAIAEGERDAQGVVYSKDGSRLLTAFNLIASKYMVRPGTQVICDSAFRGCEELISIYLPDSITSIGEAAFMDCLELTDIRLPRGITTIAPRTFEGCFCLTTIRLPNGLTTIEQSAFRECLSLDSILIPESVKYIQKQAFYRCKQLKAIYVRCFADTQLKEVRERFREMLKKCCLTNRKYMLLVWKIRRKG